MDKKTTVVIVKAVPVVCAVLTYLLSFLAIDSDVIRHIITVTLILAFLGFAFYFVGRKMAKEDKTIRTLGRLDLISTLSIIALYIFVFISIGRG